MKTETLIEFLERSPDNSSLVRRMRNNMLPLADEEIRAWFVARPQVLGHLASKRTDHGLTWLMQAIRETGPSVGTSMIASSVGEAVDSRVAFAALALSRGTTQNGSKRQRGVLWTSCESLGPSDQQRSVCHLRLASAFA